MIWDDEYNKSTIEGNTHRGLKGISQEKETASTECATTVDTIMGDHISSIRKIPEASIKYPLWRYSMQRAREIVFVVPSEWDLAWNTGIMGEKCLEREGAR